MFDDMVDYGRTAVYWDWRLTVVVSLLSVFVATRILTSIRSSLAFRATGVEKRPPIVPYSMPVIGNMLDFAFNTMQFLSSLR
jgi:hypothetical protein